ncbi:MAG: 2-oxoglutarate dehydrogenase complex dihydrolipoyllysine-residue succinyltransferase [Bacteroidetes bacterium]|nr:2-oxoglutarate dehydrogenase complex dihydrolipoyllysine-residue succinyltransferase [Bacteroidota bacterium]
MGESINEVTLSQWLVADGDYVRIDQSICEFESDKATLEFPAEKAGKIAFVAQEGQDLKIGDLVARIDTDAEAPASSPQSSAESSGGKGAAGPATDSAKAKPAEAQPAAAAAATAAKTTPAAASGNGQPAKSGTGASSASAAPASAPHASPLAAAIMADKGLSAERITGSGPGGRITRADVIKAVQAGLPAAEAVRSLKAYSREAHSEKTSRLRQTVARRLVGVKNQTAMLTTFNEVDMGPINDMRAKHKETFAKKFGVNLGYMSFFTRACCNALAEFPAVNAYYDEKEVHFHNYCDVSIAVSTPRGLVVPVLRNAESLDMHEIEAGIKDLAIRARDGKLALEEMEGGTFTITNGGVFGSLMSTPILNSPQSAILGMHKIEDRPMAICGQVVIRPMMYLALSYDHRIIDGKESVSFLVRVKEQLEHPEQLLFGKDPVEVLLGL